MKDVSRFLKNRHLFKKNAHPTTVNDNIAHLEVGFSHLMVEGRGFEMSRRVCGIHKLELRSPAPTRTTRGKARNQAFARRLQRGTA